MKFLLDTNVISEIRKGTKAHGGVLAWSRAHQAEGLAIPSVALFELQMGVEKLRRDRDLDRAARFDFWIGRIEGDGSVLPFDAAAARETARLIYGRSPDKIVDAMIAAIARVHGLTVVTRNVKDFLPFSVAVEDPFSFGRA